MLSKALPPKAAETVGLCFWEDTLVFISKDDTLTKSHVRYVEAQLIEAVKKNSNWSCFNGKKPPVTGKLPKEDAFAMDEFVEQVKTLTGTLGFDLFKVTKLASALPEIVAATIEQTESPEFTYVGNEFMARAVFLSGSTGEWVVRQKSTARLDAASTTPQGAVKLRAQLLANGVLNKTSNGLEFTKDYAFPSASSAACVVGGTSVSGPTAWKRNGKTYKDLEAEVSGETAPSDQGVLAES